MVSCNFLSSPFIICLLFAQEAVKPEVVNVASLVLIKSLASHL
jgi:hypothetical protein